MFPPNFNNYHEFVCHLIKLTNLLLWINLKVVKRKKKIRNNIPRLYTLNYYKTHVDFLIKFLIKKKLPVINSLYSHKFLINSNLTLPKSSNSISYVSPDLITYLYLFQTLFYSKTLPKILTYKIFIFFTKIDKFLKQWSIHERNLRELRSEICMIEDCRKITYRQ